MNKVNTDIKFSNDEQEVISFIKEVIDKYAPSTNAYIVGGFVRDKLLGQQSDDIDIMLSNMAGEDFAKLLTKHLNIKDAHVIKENPEKSKHITTAKTYIPLSSGKIQEIDFAQARSEVYLENSRIPEIKTATPQEDAYRRDLTINSIFYDINNNKIVDFTGQGIKDLIANTIRTPLNPLKTFSEDPLRIFRVARFAAKYNSQIDPETYKAMSDPSLREEIKRKVSKERLGTEIKKMLKNPNPDRALTLLKDTGLLEDIITESLLKTKYEQKMSPLDMEQKNVHHKLTIWGHTMQTVKNILDKYPDADPEKRATMILAALMHDLGKLFIEIQGESKTVPGSTSYYGHEKESKEIAEHILRYLKIENYIDQVSKLAQHHMYLHKLTEGNQGGIKALRRFIRKMTEESLDWIDVLNLTMADAYSKDIELDPNTIKTYQNLEEQLKEALSSMKPIKEKSSIVPVLNGNEIMETLNIKPGKWMTEIVEFVKELQDDNPDITKEEAKELLINKYKEVNLPKQIKQANKKEPSNTCPSHLFNKKQEEINDLLENDKLYEAQTLIKQLNKEYKDERVTRLIARTLLSILVKNKKMIDNEMLRNIFKEAEKNFFDCDLCSCVWGILLLIDSPTKDEVIRQMGNRIKNMYPEKIEHILNILPENINRPNIKKEFIKK